MLLSLPWSSWTREDEDEDEDEGGDEDDGADDEDADADAVFGNALRNVIGRISFGECLHRWKSLEECKQRNIR